jgi:aromatic ring-opening dioxygenase LigB subunit
MLVFAAVVPHSPLLVPSIGKEHRQSLAATLAAYEKLEQELYVVKPDTLLVISPHAPMYPDAWSGLLAETYTGSLKEFGDHNETLTAKADTMLMDHLQRTLRHEGTPFTLVSHEELDYGFTIPLMLLTQHLKHWRLVPISLSGLDAQAHYNFGHSLVEALHTETQRVAIIVSADLSHHANTRSSEGGLPEGEQFDACAKACLETLNPDALLNLPLDVREKSGQCGLNPILMLLGGLQNIKAKSHVLCYEAPFGVGYLTAEIRIA